MEKCEVPCSSVNTALKEVWEAVRAKASTRLVLFLFGMIFSFCVVAIGGAQWKIFEKVSDINTKISIEMTAQSKDLSHLKEKIDRMDTP